MRLEFMDENSLFTFKYLIRTLMDGITTESQRPLTAGAMLFSTAIMASILLFTVLGSVSVSFDLPACLCEVAITLVLVPFSEAVFDRFFPAPLIIA